jgi:hypothetical protein
VSRAVAVITASSAKRLQTLGPAAQQAVEELRQELEGNPKLGIRRGPVRGDCETVVYRTRLEARENMPGLTVVYVYAPHPPPQRSPSSLSHPTTTEAASQHRSVNFPEIADCCLRATGLRGSPPVRCRGFGLLPSVSTRGRVPGRTGHDQRITCGRNRAYSSVTRPSDSRMPRPAASSPTTQAPRTTRLPSKDGNGASSW